MELEIAAVPCEDMELEIDIVPRDWVFEESGAVDAVPWDDVKKEDDATP